MSEPERVPVEDPDGRRGLVLKLADPLSSPGSLDGSRYSLLDGTPLLAGSDGLLEVPGTQKRLRLL